ncbi:MAG: hypothetical protein AAF199_00475 [Pseudomonadota bacterium]
MVDKDKKAKTKSDAAAETPPIEAVDAEIVESDLEAAPSQMSSPNDQPEDVEPVSVSDTEKAVSDDKSDASGDDEVAVEDAGSASADKGGFSPGVVFLAVLALVGVVATALWTTGANRTNGAGENTDVATQSDANPAIGDAPSTAETIEPDTSPAPSKTANAVGAGAKSAAQSIDPDTVAAAERSALPAAPAIAEGGGNAALQQAAKRAAQALTTDGNDQQPISDQAASQTQTPERFTGDVAETKAPSAGSAADDATSLAVTDFLPDEEATPTPTVSLAPVLDSDPQSLNMIKNGADHTGETMTDRGDVDPAAAKVSDTPTPETPMPGGVDPEAAAAELFAADPQSTAGPIPTDNADAALAQTEDRSTGTQETLVAGTSVQGSAEEETIAQLLEPGDNPGADDGAAAGTNAKGDADRNGTSNAVAAGAALAVTNANIAGAETTEVAGTADAPPSTTSEPLEPPSEPAVADADTNISANEDSARAVAEQFAGEIAALEDSFEERTQRIADALETERARAAMQAEEIATLKRELDDALEANAERSSAEIASLRARIDQLQAREAQKKSNTEQQTRALLSIISLQREFDKGQPYASELSVLKQVMPGAIDFAPLEVAAQTGAPTLTALQEQFPAAIRTTLADQNKGAKGPIGHVLRNLQSLVSVRPATPQAGDAPAAIISRAENALEQGQLGEALTQLDALGENASDEMRDWVAAAQMRAKASGLVARLNDRLLAGVSQ